MKTKYTQSSLVFGVFGMNLKEYHSEVKGKELKNWCEKAKIVKKDPQTGVKYPKLIDRVPVEIGGSIVLSNYDTKVILEWYEKLCK